MQKPLHNGLPLQYNPLAECCMVFPAIGWCAVLFIPTLGLCPALRYSLSACFLYSAVYDAVTPQVQPFLPEGARWGQGSSRHQDTQSGSTGYQ